MNNKWTGVLYVVTRKSDGQPSGWFARHDTDRGSKIVTSTDVSFKQFFEQVTCDKQQEELQVAEFVEKSVLSAALNELIKAKQQIAELEMKLLDAEVELGNLSMEMSE